MTGPVQPRRRHVDVAPDYLQQISRCHSHVGIAELVWNALDADPITRISVSGSREEIPRTRMRPWSGKINPVIMFISVVLPEPFGPTRLVIPGGRTGSPARVSAAMFYTGDRFPHWRGSLFVGGMARQRLVRLTLDGQRVVSEEALVPSLGRIRDVRQGPDGDIYLVTDNREGKPTPILKIEPIERGPIK